MNNPIATRLRRILSMRMTATSASSSLSSSSSSTTILSSSKQLSSFNLQSSQPSRLFSSKNEFAASALLEAASRNDVKLLQELVNKGCDLNKGDYDKRRALHIAASEGSVDVAKYLLSHKVDINAEDRWGNTAMDDAIQSKQDNIIPILRQAGASVGKNKNTEYVSMLCQSASEGNVHMLQRLHHAGINMNLADYDLRTPLHVAASEGHLATVDFLIKAGANVNVVDRFGNTPLVEASRSRSKQRKSTMQLLISQGAQMESSDFDISRDPTLQGSISRSLQFLSNRAGNAYTECWLPNEDETEFILTESMIYCPRELQSKLQSFLSVQPETFSNSQQNVIGKAYSEKKAFIVSDLTEKLLPLRFQQAKSCGLRTGFVVPIVHNDNVLAVLKFFFTADQQPQLSDADLQQFQRFASGIVEAGISHKGSNIYFNSPADVPKGQMQEVFDLIVGEEVFNANLVYNELDWFYSLGLQKYYFERFATKDIANHIHSYIAAKKLALTTGRPEEVMLNIETKNKDGNMSVLCMCPIEHSKQVEVEKIIQSHINKLSKDKTKAYTMEMFMSKNTIIPGGKSQLGLYVLETSDWSNPSKVGSSDQNISEVSSQLFIRTKTKEIKERYQQVMSSAILKLSPLAEVFPVYRDGTIPLMFAFLQSAGTTTPYMLQLTELLRNNGLVAHRKFTETFANNMIVYSLYLNPPVNNDKIDQLLKQFSMLHLVPENSLTPRFLSGEYTAEQYTYMTAASRFIYYFLNRRSEEFDVLARSLKNDPLNLGRLRLLQTRLKREAVSQDRISSVVVEYPRLIRDLFADFQRNITTKRDMSNIQLNPGLVTKIKSEATNPLDEQVLTALLTFNSYLLKTNFYKKGKSSLSFRIDPRFLADSDWPQIPYGLFFVMGSDFQGFHIRFADVARGGIRMIRSADRQSYGHNLETLFQENFGLAYTQNKKNKDIPEFGSKGTVLLNLGQTNTFLPFQKYVSGLLDLLVPTEEIVDNYGREEILFLGPDEGTADYMEWAARYAAKRGYKFWRAFTTGKPLSLGGIPHDKFGMTTRSVHRYVLGCLRKLGLKEEDVTKFQTGGPDGDLGSNEILISKDRTTAIVDGSGVVYDPNGLDRTETSRLAHSRQMIKHFDVSKLSPQGFRVLVTDTNVVLPSGELVASGLAFRNDFHLHSLSSADFFVPCGGRPEAVNLTNVSKMFDSKGKPRFKVVVEGANLFFTQDARMILEQAGVILYKDASANKGGVTSSSLEVLAALALSTEEFDKHMAVKDESNPPAFYMEYVKEIQQRIEGDAELEFECIWREHERTGTARYLLTDAVSDKINSLNNFIQKSSLWNNIALRHAVLQQAIPKRLTDLLGIETVMKRVPENYTQAIFGAYLASRYVYKHGLDANEFAFFEFMQPYIRESSKK